MLLVNDDRERGIYTTARSGNGARGAAPASQPQSSQQQLSRTSHLRGGLIHRRRSSHKPRAESLHGCVSQLPADCPGGAELLSLSRGAEGRGPPGQGELRAPSAVTLPQRSRSPCTAGRGRSLQTDTLTAQPRVRALHGAARVAGDPHLLLSLPRRGTGCRHLLGDFETLIAMLLGIQGNRLLAPTVSFAPLAGQPCQP